MNKAQNDETIKNTLAAKLEQYDLLDITANFLKHYDLALVGLYPEILFPELPPDECFETLASVKASLLREPKSNAEMVLSDVTIKKLLTIPISTVNNVISLICNLSGCPYNIVRSWYDKNVELYLVSAESVQKVHDVLTVFFCKAINQYLYNDALVLGEDETRRRLELLVQTTGIYAPEVVYEMYGRNGSLGFLLFPYLSDPTEAMLHLHSLFGQETTAHILKTDFWCLFDYKNAALEAPVIHDNGLDKMKSLVAAYQSQESFEAELRTIYDKITPMDYDEVWKEDFLPRYIALKESFIQYPICPKLMRRLCATVTAFKLCGGNALITEEFERFCIH